jgi:beta-mannosidase
MFSWDIMPRLVSAGIFRPAKIIYKPVHHIRQAYLMTQRLDTARKTASLSFFFDLDLGRAPISDFLIKVEGRCGDSSFTIEKRLWFSSGKLDITLNDARFWWPKGYGGQSLYDCRVTLLRNGNLADSYFMRTGIRKVTLERTSTTDMFLGGDFHFEVNNRRVFVMGTNWVPVDAYHSRDKERIPRIMKLLEDINCNAVRCWGGNVYEDPVFYNLCDEMGIMVWQDFAMACGIYPIDGFSDTLRAEAQTIVRQLRHHPSIVLWAGDNECDQFLHVHESNGRDPNRNRLTRQVLPDVLYMEDPTRPYLPSSPYVDEHAWKFPERCLPENHLWGPRDYYKSSFYRDSICSFASEMGYHGCPSTASIKKFISPEKLWPWQDNDEWMVHAASPETSRNGIYAYRIELMAKQIKELFGYIPDSLEDFVLASQISQAEAKKFFVELFRTGQPKRTGIIWWNLIDGWPQFSDAVVDYYFDRKLAYYFIKQSQQPLLLTFTEPHDWRLRLCAVNNAGKALEFEYTVRDYTTGEQMLSGYNACGDHAVFELASLPYSQGEKRMYIIEWKSGEYSGQNHYLTGNPPFDLDFYHAFLKDVYAGYVSC